MRVRFDSFEVETDVHFPTDYNLLWDSARKCIEGAEKLNIPGWRKHKHWKRRLKGLMRAVGKASSSGGRGKGKRVRKSAGAYLKKAKALEKKVTVVLSGCLKDVPQETTPAKSSAITIRCYLNT